MRLNGDRTINDIDPELHPYVDSFYNLNQLENLKSDADKYLYSAYFPPMLIESLSKAGVSAIESMFKGVKAKSCQPILVNDHIINTEMTCLLPVNLEFTNGYLALLMRDDIAKLSSASKLSGMKKYDCVNYSDHVIRELMNLFWGIFKYDVSSRFKVKKNKYPINLPIVVGHHGHYINFGSNIPQIILRYFLSVNDPSTDVFLMEFKAIFNQRMNPQDFQFDSEYGVQRHIDSGDLELF